MLAIAKTETDRLVAFEFDQPLDPARDLVSHLRWVVEDYDQRRDDQWRATPPDGTSVLLRLLKEPGPPKRTQALLRAIGWYGYGPGDATQPVLEYLDDEDIETRRCAIGALGRLGDYETIDRLTPFLSEDELRSAAAYALCKFGKAEVLPELEAAAAADPALSDYVVEAKRRIDAIEADDAEAFVEAILEGDQYEDAVVFLVAYRSVAFDMLLDTDRDLILRWRAARVLGFAPSPRCSSVLIQALAEPELPYKLALQIVESMGNIRTPRAVDPLVDLLSKADLELQRAIVVALGKIGQPVAFEPLLALWQDGDDSLKPDLRLALRRLADPCDALVNCGLYPVVIREIFVIEQTGQAPTDLTLTKDYPPQQLLDEQLGSEDVNARFDTELLWRLVKGDWPS